MFFSVAKIVVTKMNASRNVSKLFVYVLHNCCFKPVIIGLESIMRALLLYDLI